MPNSRWDAFPDMVSLRQAMDRLLEDAWIRPWGMAVTGGASTVPIDLFDTGDELVLTAPLPGVKPGDIDITIQGDVLRIQGEMKGDSEIKDEQFHRRERHVGHFAREVTLPSMVKSDAVRAHFENGVLELHLPKAEEARARRIQIQNGSNPQLGTGKVA